MELFEFQSKVRSVNKLLEFITANYDVKLTNDNIDHIIHKNSRLMSHMMEHVQDSVMNPTWNEAKLILETAKKVKKLMESEPTYRIDQKTGALLNFQPSADGPESIASRPDLYWRQDDSDTPLVIPQPYSQEEFDAAARELGTNDVPQVAPSGGTGMYVGVNTPGAQDTVINHRDGQNQAVKTVVDTDSGVVDSQVVDQRSTMKDDGTQNPNGLYTQSGGDESDKHKSKIKSVVAGSNEKVNEDMAKNHILMLAESEIEKAQIVMAVNNEIVEKLQRDAEKMSNMKIDVLGPIVERIKAEHGLEPAENFRDTITRLLDQALDQVMHVKDQIHTETLKLTGDISSAPELEQDLGMEAGMDAGADEIAMDDPLGGEEFAMDDEFAEDPELEVEPMPAEREMKESRKFGLVLESTKGTMGKKYFDSKADMKNWLAENKSKIGKVHKILKD